LHTDVWRVNAGIAADDWQYIAVSCFAFYMTFPLFWKYQSSDADDNPNRLTSFQGSSLRTTSTMKIRAAQSEDLEAIKALLAENELPVADVNAAMLADFVVAEDESGKIVGSVGLERLGANALLRSLAVARTARNERLGTTLLAYAESMARASDISDLWLLTTTAAGFFRRMGYADVERSKVAAQVKFTMQFAQLCPATAACMRKTL
jgi:amino-acid N-acetyltransferase